MKSNLTIYAGGITASSTSRMLGGDIVRYGVAGRTSAGLLRVRPGGLEFPEDLTRVKLTKEHDRADSRGYLQSIEHFPDRIRAAVKVSDGPLGDAALTEAGDKTRDGFSFDVVDAVIEGDEIVSAKVIAIGQVGIPAYDDTRIDTIAASQTPASPNHTGDKMTPEQIARLAALRAQSTRNDAEEAELVELAGLESPASTSPEAGDSTPAPAGEAVAASFSAVPPGVPAPSGQQSIRVNEGNAFERFVSEVTAAYRNHNPRQAITAALADVTYTAHGSVIQQPAWSGELWSGVDQDPEWTDLFNSGDMLQLNGEGWRFTTKPQIQDYSGDKAAIPTTAIGTERVPWTGARMAVGNDFDRAFYDFPNEELIRSYAEFVRKDWVIKLDAKVRAFTLANATALAGVAAQPTLLKAASKLARGLKRRKVGKMSFIVANDDDYDTLMDITKNDVPAFLELFGIDPANFRSSADVPQGTVIGGVKQAATVRTLPGSPIRVDAQHIANGGIDTAFFGYWAIQENHDAGIAKVTFTAPAE